MTTEPYDIRQHLAVLTPSKDSKTKYHCPVCNGDDLDISKDGAYSCFNSNCEPKDIRVAIDKLEGKPDWKPEKFVKPIRPKSSKDYFYPNRDGNSLVKVTRSDSGNGKKSFYQSHWDGCKWMKGNPDEVKKQIPIYRYQEVKQAIERQELIFWVEGESTADLLWDLGITATTTIGGSGGYSSYGDYLEDLIGARLVLAPDRDSNGLKYISNIEQDFPNQIKGYYLAGSSGLWSKPAGGMDIGDDIADHSYTKEQILEKVISPGEYQEATKPSKRPSLAGDKHINGKKSNHSLDDTAQSNYKGLAATLGIRLEYKEGDIACPLNKLRMDLFEMFGDRIKLNLMTCDYELDGIAIDVNNAKTFVSEKLGRGYSTENCILAIHSIASRHAYHPVKQYLESLKAKVAEDFDILNNIATLFLGNSDPLANKMMAKTLVGAVARVMQPGTKVDTLTVLQGGQGVGKSTFLKVLGGADWFCDDIRDLENKDELAKLARYWIIELAEVDYLMGRKEVESFKRFFSTTADTYRPPYGRANIRHDRTCALFATTNKTEFLKDPTGDRRYWVVEVGSEIDCERVTQTRDLIWATALAAFERGDTWWLNGEEEQSRAASHTQYRESDVWGDAITEKFKGSLPTTNCESGEWLTTNQIFDLLDIPTKDRSRASSNRVTKILKEWGFESKSMRIDGDVRKVWFRSTENVILQNIENIRLQSYKVTEPTETSTERQMFLLPNLLPNIPDNGIGYSSEKDGDITLLPNNSLSSHPQHNKVTQTKIPHSNDSDEKRSPVTLLPSTFQTMEKRKISNVGDRVLIPNCGKYGKVERIEPQEGKKGLYARVILDDGSEKWVLPECLEVVTSSVEAK